MPPLRFCANITMMFTQEAPNCLLDRYALAAQAGFKAVECAFPYEFTKEEVADVKKKFGLQQILINAEPGENGKGFAAIPGKEDRFRESLIKSLEYCKALDCKKLHLMSGLTKVDQESKSAMMNNLRSAIPLLEESGVVGLIEPINPYSVPGYFLHDFELAESIVKELNSPFLRLQLDVFHLQFLRGDLTNSINRFLPITGSQIYCSQNFFIITTLYSLIRSHSNSTSA